MKLFNKRASALKKWHRRALVLNISKTRIIFGAAERTKPKNTNVDHIEGLKLGHVPPWIYKRYVSIPGGALDEGSPQRSLAGTFSP